MGVPTDPETRPPSTDRATTSDVGRLLEVLPRPPAHLGVLGLESPGRDLVSALAAAGFRISDCGPRLSSTLPLPLPDESAAAKLDGWLLGSGAEAPGNELLAALREQVRDGGRLVLLLPAAGSRPGSPGPPDPGAEAPGDAASRDGAPPAYFPEPARDATRRALYETRWVILDEPSGWEPAPGRRVDLIVARPGDHRIRPYRPGDEAAILELFESAFHHRRSLERWRWAYEADPWGAGRISLAEDRSGRIAAHYAGYPVPFWSDLDGVGRHLVAHQVGDTMTAKEARRVGRGRTNLLTRTVHHFYASWCRGRIAFNYGTNTGKIQRFSRRTAGARRVEPAPYRMRSLAEPFSTPSTLGLRLGGWRVETVDVDALDERWDELWDRVRSAYRFLVARDRRYLAWRYRCPDVDYSFRAVYRRRTLVGWSVFRRQDDRLVWGDALFDPHHPGAAAILLAAAASSPELRDATTLEAWFADRPSWWDRIVTDLGFRRAPEPQDLGLVYVPFEEDPGEAMARHLYYTKGDFDLF